MCETLWRPKMTPDELFECISQAMMSALDRDASSGKLSFYEN
jgi:20S proteasome subunit beta 3